MSKTKQIDPVVARLTEDLAVLRAAYSKCDARIEALPDEGFDPDLVMATCTIARAITGLESELRAKEKDIARAHAAMKPELVMEWLRKQPEETRLHFLRELSATLDGPASVLA